MISPISQPVSHALFKRSCPFLLYSACFSWLSFINAPSITHQRPPPLSPRALYFSSFSLSHLPSSVSPRLLTVIRNAVAVITTRPQLPANTSSHLDEEYVNRELEAELERQEDDLWADRRPVSPRVAKEHIADLQHALAKVLISTKQAYHTSYHY